MRKLRFLLALLAIFSLFAVSCGDDDSADEPEPAAGDDGDEMAEDEDDMEESAHSGLTFYMITHSDEGPFWSVVKRGAQAAADAVGATLVWQGSNNDPAVQVTDIAAAVAADADGIAASLPSPDQLIPPLQDAVAAGIPVYTLNSGVNDYQTIGATSHVGQTEIIAGNGAGHRFNDLGATKLLCGIQEQDNVALGERCDGLAETFNGEVVQTFMDLDANQVAQEGAINAALAADSDIDGFLGVGPVIAVSGLNAAKALGKDVGNSFFVGGFDITPDIIDAIEAGEVAFTVDQQQYLQGYIPIVLMFLEVTNQNTLGGGLPILTGPGFVTPDNAAAVKALVAAGTR